MTVGIWFTEKKVTFQRETTVEISEEIFNVLTISSGQINFQLNFDISESKKTKENYNYQNKTKRKKEKENYARF